MGDERTELLLTTTVGYRITGDLAENNDMIENFNFKTLRGVCLDVDAQDDDDDEDDPSDDGVVLLAIGTWRSTGLA